MTDCIFCNIAGNTMPADIVYSDTEVVAFTDINPQAPTHVVIIPRKHIASLSQAAPDDATLLGKLLTTVQMLAGALGIDESGYRLVVNNGDDGGQTVPHIHVHLLGGRPMAWPPG
jgi:histidine triad (HIT) family protein